MARGRPKSIPEVAHRYDYPLVILPLVSIESDADEYIGYEVFYPDLLGCSPGRSSNLQTAIREAQKNAELWLSRARSEGDGPPPAGGWFREQLLDIAGGTEQLTEVERLLAEIDAEGRRSAQGAPRVARGRASRIAAPVVGVIEQKFYAFDVGVLAGKFQDRHPKLGDAPDEQALITLRQSSVYMAKVFSLSFTE